jgi:S1-C subfamily serine protease/pSer/pThr/pTyr-binding forkhead associated (FHA) protein
MKMMLYHLTGSLRGRTQYFDTADGVSFGIGLECGVVFDGVKDSVVCARHADLSVQDHTPIIRDRSGRDALLVNGRQTTESALKDGDLIQFGEDGPVVRFRLIPEGAPEKKPLKTIVADYRDVVMRAPHPRYLSPVILVRHLLTDIVRYASPAVRIATALLILVPLLTIAMLGGVAYRQHHQALTSQRQMAELLRQLESERLTQAGLERRIEEERRHIAELSRLHEELVGELKASVKQRETARASQAELRAIREQLSTLQGEQRFAEGLVARVGSGVGLLQGGYGFVERGTGRPLRYQGLDREHNPYVDEQGNPVVTVEGAGPPVIIFYAGSGFLVDRSGTILTNRHLIKMWEHYEPTRQAIEAGYKPHLVLLRMFFPGNPEPFKLEVLGVSEAFDVAVLRTDRPPSGSTPLRLAEAEESPKVGEPVVVLSYPGTFESLLGRLARPVSDDILHEARQDPVMLADLLARRNLIRPLATQGHVADFSTDTLTFAASSAGGSSGGPVFDRAGRVIAINYALLRKVGGLNLGLRITRVHELLAQMRITLEPAPDARERVRR